MRTTQIACALAGVTAIAAACPARAAEIQWSKSFHAAMAEAKSAHKLVMADFYTDW